jgi:PAS domain S-box-containing protein
MLRSIDLTRLTAEEIRELRRFEAVSRNELRLLELIAGGTLLPKVLEEMALSFEAIFPGAIGSVLLLDNTGKRLLAGAGPHLPPDYIRAIAGIEIGPRVGSCGTAAFLGESILVSDIPNDPRWRDLVTLAAEYDLKACWSIPIFSRNRTVLGTLAIYFRECRVAQPQDILALERSAHIASVAIESRRAEQELLAHQQQLLAKQILLAESQRAAHIGSWAIELPGQQLVWSEEAYRVWSVCSQKFTPDIDSSLRLIHPDDVAAMQEWLRACLAREKPAALEFRLPQPDGDFRVLKHEGVLVVDEWDRALRMVGTIQDITEKRRSEAILRVSHQALRSVSKGILITDAEHRILSANNAFLTITGYSEEELLGQHCQFLQGPETDAETLNQIRCALRDKKEFSGEILNYRKDGTPFWNEMSISPVRDEQGYWTHFIGITRDITLRKQTLLALAKNQAELELAFNTSLTGMALLDMDGRFLRVNPSFGSILGRTEQEMLQMDISSITHPEDSPLDPNVLQEFLTGKRESVLLERRYRHKDGHYLWAQLNTSLMRNVHGMPLHFMSQMRDITESKRTQQLLLESENRFRTAFAHAAVGMVLTDISGRVLQANETYARITGYSVDELAILDLSLLYFPGDLQRSRLLIQQVVRGEIPAFDIEQRYIRKDGSLVWVHNSITLTRDIQGQPAQIITLCRDVTEQRHLDTQREELLISERAIRSQAERANRIKNEFLSTLSHELRTPLNAIMGWVELLKEADSEPGLLDEGLTVISRNVRAQATLIDDLLDMSRIESGQLRITRKYIDLREVLTAAIAVVTPAAEAKGIRIFTGLSPVNTSMNGDPDRLQQVMWNLLTNAVKFTAQGGQVNVSLTPIKSAIEITDSDNGQGIVPEFLPHVFDRFRQQDASMTRRQGGLGLGLSLVKELVGLHGGTVQVSSPGQGQGATFTVVLPSNTPEVACREVSSHRARIWSKPANPSLDGARILVVEDEPDSRELVRRILEAEGAKVLPAANAEEGLELLRQEKPEVILSDIGMPGHDGYQFIQWVRSLNPHEGGNAPAAAFTAFARPEDRARALEAGFQIHLVKPVKPTQLIATVTQLLEIRTTLAADSTPGNPA